MLTLSGVYLTVKDLAEKWNCTILTVTHHIRNGGLQAQKIGQTYLVSESEAVRFINDNKGKLRFLRE
jgi:excisionase family DNA binding protein